MTLWKKIILWLVWSLSYGIMIIPNIYILIDNLIIGQAQKTQWSFGIALVLYIILIITKNLIGKRINRKLQSIDIADELGVVGQTPIWLKRILQSLEIIIPFAVLGLILYGLDKVTVPSHEIITDMLWFVVFGMAGLFVHDYIKKSWMLEMLIDKEMKLQDSVKKKREKLSAKELRKEARAKRKGL